MYWNQLRHMKKIKNQKIEKNKEKNKIKKKNNNKSFPGPSNSFDGGSIDHIIQPSFLCHTPTVRILLLSFWVCVDAKNNTKTLQRQLSLHLSMQSSPSLMPFRSHMNRSFACSFALSRSRARLLLFWVSFCLGLKIFAQLAADFRSWSVEWSGETKVMAHCPVFELRKPLFQRLCNSLGLLNDWKMR